jgi:hypothetical protein
MKLAFSRQHFVNNSYTEIHKNRTSGSVADTGPHTARWKDREYERTLSQHEAFSLLKKRLRNAIFLQSTQVFNFDFYTLLIEEVENIQEEGDKEEIRT